MDKPLIGLPDTVIAPRTDPIYNCHSYLTKVPVAAIEPFIRAFSKPGDVVADFFAGSGMTGLAAMMLGRHAHLSDISALGKHIAEGYLIDVLDRDLSEASETAVRSARGAIGDLYLTERASDREAVEMVRTVWSFTYACPHCNAPLVYFEHLSREGAAAKACPHCREAFIKRKWGGGEDVPVEVVVRGEDGRQATQEVTGVDREKIVRAEKDRRRDDVPSLRIEEHREMYSRSGLGKAGLTVTSMFFSARNAIALLELWRAINGIEKHLVRQKLLFAFTAILPRASRRYQWSRKRPLNAQNQTYYIAPVYYEWNVFDLFGRKVGAAMRASELVRKRVQLRGGTEKPKVTYTLASGDALTHLSDGTIDYVFTDPPFGSNMFYSDMSLFHEAWLGVVTDHQAEAVVHTTGKRKAGAEDRYRGLLKRSFDEAFRVLKPRGYMSVVFGNSSGRIWGLVQRALRDAGFGAAPVHVAILDKGQRSVKGLSSGSEGVVTVDLILTVRKSDVRKQVEGVEELRQADTDELMRAAISELSVEEARNPSHLYARILRIAIRQHLVLDDLHLSNVLISLRNAGYSVDQKTGLFWGPPLFFLFK